MLGLIQPPTRLDYLPARASFITGSVDHPKKTKSVSINSSSKEVSTQNLKQDSTVSNQQHLLCKLVINKEQMLHSYLDVFESIGCFQGPLYHIQLDPSITLKQTPCRQSWCTWKKLLNKKLTRYWKSEFWRQYVKPPHGLTALCLLRGKTRLTNWSLESAWISQILIKQ